MLVPTAIYVLHDAFIDFIDTSHLKFFNTVIQQCMYFLLLHGCLLSS